MVSSHSIKMFPYILIQSSGFGSYISSFIMQVSTGESYLFNSPYIQTVTCGRGNYMLVCSIYDMIFTQLVVSD
jgi:hypothetical protein